jgi:methionyl-tRNA formyltransferase
MALRILFAGASEIATPCFRVLASRGELVGLLTSPDTPQGRGLRLTPSALALEAATLTPELPVLKPEHLLGPEREAVAALKPDLLVSFSYGKIFGPKFLALFARGGLNIHPSLLPKYRGCSPIQSAILNQDPETGLTVQRLALKMDEGDILAQERITLSPSVTSGELSAWAAECGARHLAQVLDQLKSGSERPIPQNSAEATYTRMFTKNDGEIDWSAPAAAISAQIRAFNPWPEAYTYWKGLRLSLTGARLCSPETKIKAADAGQSLPGQVLGIDKKQGILVQTGKGLLALTQLKLEKKKELAYMDFINGSRDFIGSHLGNA